MHSYLEFSPERRMSEPISLTLHELAERWKLSPRQMLDHALQRGLPLYFYFDGLVFDFADKWHRAGGDAEALRQLAAQQERLEVIQLALQRQTLHRQGWLKLTRWESAFDDVELARHQADQQRLQGTIDTLSARLAERQATRQRSIRNGLLRAAPRTIRALAEHGQVAFPAYAYLPPSAPDKAAIVALEEGFPLRAILSASELCASIRDVQQWEADLDS